MVNHATPFQSFFAAAAWAVAAGEAYLNIMISFHERGQTHACPPGNKIITSASVRPNIFSCERREL